MFSIPNDFRNPYVLTSTAISSSFPHSLPDLTAASHLIAPYPHGQSLRRRWAQYQNHSQRIQWVTLKLCFCLWNLNAFRLHLALTWLDLDRLDVPGTLLHRSEIMKWGKTPATSYKGKTNDEVKDHSGIPPYLCPTFWNLLRLFLSSVQRILQRTEPLIDGISVSPHSYSKCNILLHRRKNTLSNKEWSQTHFQVSTERCRWYFSFGDKPSQSIRSINTNTAFAICQMLNYTKVATQGMGQGAWDKKNTLACGL